MNPPNRYFAMLLLSAGEWRKSSGGSLTGRGVGAWLQFGEALADLHLVADGFFPIMVLHLGVDEPGDVALVAAQHLARVFFGQISLEVPHRLAGEIVKQVGMVVVGDIVKIHEAADDVIFEPGFFDAARPSRD